MTERERLALAEQIIEKAQVYVLRDPNWKPDGPGIHTRTSADVERQDLLHRELEPLFAQWQQAKSEATTHEESEAAARQLIRDSGHPMRDDPAEQTPRDLGLDDDVSRRD